MSADLNPVSVSVPRAAELLGISARSVWQLIRTGALPAARLTRRVLIPYSVLLQFVATHTDSTGACVDSGLSARRKATANAKKEPDHDDQ